jgi:hypothetical protein
MQTWCAGVRIGWLHRFCQDRWLEVNSHKRETENGEEIEHDAAMGAGPSARFVSEPPLFGKPLAEGSWHRRKREEKGNAREV